MTDRPLKPLRNRKAVVAALGLVAVITLFMASYSGAFANPRPHGIPVAVVGPAAVTRQLATSPTLDVHRSNSPAQVRHLIEDRTVYGGLIWQDGRHLQLDVASGAGHSVAGALTTFATAVADRSGAQLTITDLAPLNQQDAQGTAEFYCIVFLTLGGFIGASVLGRLMGTGRDFAGRALFLALYTALLAAAFATVADVGFGTLTGHFGFLFLILWAGTTAACLAAAGVAASLGTAAALFVIVATVILGNPSSGGPVGRPLLSSFYSSLTSFFPQGAGLTMVRGAQYFGGRGVAAAAPTLAVWGGVGLLLLASAAFRHRRSRSGDVMFGRGDGVSGGSCMKVAVITDSAASLPVDETATLGIGVVPMGLVVDGVVYADGQLDPADLLAQSSTEPVTTSAPSPGDFAEAIAAADAEDGTLLLTVCRVP